MQIFFVAVIVLRDKFPWWTVVKSMWLINICHFFSFCLKINDSCYSAFFLFTCASIFLLWWKISRWKQNDIELSTQAYNYNHRFKNGNMFCRVMVNISDNMVEELGLMHEGQLLTLLFVCHIFVVSQVFQAKNWQKLPVIVRRYF